MARVFTSNFNYNDRSYIAVISEKEGAVSIYIPDEDLQTLLPDSRISFNPEEGFQSDVQLNEKAKHLLRSILEQTEIKLSKTPAPKSQQQ